MSNLDHLLSFNNHRYSGFLVIPCPDKNAGMSAMMTYALNGVRLALDRNLIPVINFNYTDRKFFYDALLGPNIWDYYWEPVMGLSYETLQELIKDSQIDSSLVSTLSIKDVFYAHLRDPLRIGTFPYGKEIVVDHAKWMSNKRDLGREYVAKYVRVKSHILEKAKTLQDRLLHGSFVFGVHIRGTDFGYAEATRPSDYFAEIERLTRQYNLDSYKIFIATDQVQFVETFRARYADKVICYDAIRSTNQVAPFKDMSVSPYKKGEDVLIDILLLAKCDYVLKCAGAVGEYALWFNPKVAFTDFALKSIPIRDDGYEWTKGAFLRLNVADEGILLRSFRRVRCLCSNFFEYNILEFDPYAWRKPRTMLRNLKSWLSPRVRARKRAIFAFPERLLATLKKGSHKGSK